MKLNSDFIPNSRPDAVETMAYAMEFLFENFIQDKISIENADEVTAIGQIFHDMAEKAEAYYTLQEQGYELNENSLN